MHEQTTPLRAHEHWQRWCACETAEKLRGWIPLDAIGGVPPLAPLVDRLPHRKARTKRSTRAGGGTGSEATLNAPAA